MIQPFHAGHQISFPYTNHRGETRVRVAEILGVDYGSNEWYPEPQWFLRCTDLEKNVTRSFALARIDPQEIRKL